MSREQGLGRRKDDVPRGRPDDTGNARPLASAAARVSWQPSLYLCGAVGGIGGLAYGPTDGGWAFAINSRNLIIVGRCSPSLQPKRQATWWRLQRSQPRSSLSVTRMKGIESGMWNLKASPDGLAARIGRFGGTDLTVSAGQRRCADRS